jgi:hypothetical protein
MIDDFFFIATAIALRIAPSIAIVAVFLWLLLPN